MATLWVHVWEDAVAVALGAVIQRDSVAIGATSVQSDAITGSNRQHRRVRLMADVDCYIEIDGDPTADATSIPLGAENPEYFSIEAEQMVAVIERE